MKARNKNFQMVGIYLMANIINKAIAFITIPIFTRLLTTSEYGIVSTYSSYVMILQYFMGLSSEYTIRNAHVEFKDDITRYMASVFSLSMVCGIIVSIIVLIINSFLIHVSTTFICICCLGQSFMMFIINASSYNLMMKKEHKKRAFLIAGPNIVSVVWGIIIILLLSSHKENGRILGYVISFIIFGGVCLVAVFKEQNCNFSIKYWKYILKIAPPLVIHGLSVIALSQLDRIMITSMRNSTETGIYSIVYSLSMIASAVTQAIQGIWTPWFTEKYVQKKYLEIEKKAKVYLALIAIMMSLIMLVAPEVLKFMTPASYWNGISMIPPLVLTSYFIYVYSYYVGLELHEKRTKTISSLTLIATASNLILNYIFIPKYGALAAAFTTLFSYVLLFILHGMSCKQINNNVFKFRNFILPSLVTIAIVPVFYLFQDNLFIRWGVAFIIFSFTTIKCLHYKVWREF